MIQVRLQDKMNEMNSKSNAIPLQMIDSVHKNLREINELKLKLGLIGEKREELKSDAYKALDLLKDKFKKWRSENQGTRHLVCPHCGKMIMLKIRTNIWEAQKHPFFQDRILTNKHLVQLYAEKKLTKEDVAAILETSPDYVDWLLERWKENRDGVNKNSRENENNESDESGESSVRIMSEEKRARENRCPTCEIGYLSCRLAEDGSGVWEEHCTSDDCEYHKIYVNRRKQNIPINFPERRKAPSSLQNEETENDKQGNSEGSKI
jgi:DNA-directed RNA polymerase subunit RPC12/RpoP